MSLEKNFVLKGLEPRYPIVQGGMGVGISLYDLASAVGIEGGIGTLSSAIIDQLTTRRLGLEERMTTIEATARETADTKETGGIAAMNIMCAVINPYEDTVHGAVEGGVDLIVSGAGLPTQLPSMVEKYAGKDHGINLVPIISSVRALNLLIRRFWDKQGYRPDAIVLEGPKAGGHIGWRYDDIEKSGDNFNQDYDLIDNLLGPVLDFAEKYPNDYGPIPVIVAGGIYTHKDIVHALDQGASAVQLGSRFAVTVESGASADFKKAVISATKDDIVIAKKEWGSPCGYPFRYLTSSPLAQNERKKDSFCICTGLLGAVDIDNTDKLGTKGYPRGCPERYVLDGDKPCPATNTTDYSAIYTIGSEGYRIDRIMTVKELMKELIG